MLFDHARSDGKDRGQLRDKESVTWDPYLVKAVRQCQPAALSENTAIAMDELGSTSERRLSARYNRR